MAHTGVDAGCTEAGSGWEDQVATTGFPVLLFLCSTDQRDLGLHLCAGTTCQIVNTTCSVVQKLKWKAELKLDMLEAKQLLRCILVWVMREHDPAPQPDLVFRSQTSSPGSSLLPDPFFLMCGAGGTFITTFRCGVGGTMRSTKHLHCWIRVWW